MDKPQLVSSEGTPITMHPHHPNLLLVDDTLINLELLEDIFDGKYNLPVAHNGEEAQALLSAYPELFDAVLLDRMMPGLQGEDVLKWMHSQAGLKHIPVIMQTAKSSDADIKEGFHVGADFYVTKPYDEEQLQIITKNAVDRHHRHRGVVETMQQSSEMAKTLSLLDSGSLNFKVRTLHQAKHLAMLLANVSPSPERYTFGLVELLYNSIEHGMLGITYDEKTELNNEQRWHEEVEHRLELPENQNKHVDVLLKRFDDPTHGPTVHVVLSDHGAGFDFKEYLEVKEERLFDNHGRGIAVIAVCAFDQLIYNDIGNEVTAVIHLKG